MLHLVDDPFRSSTAAMARVLGFIVLAVLAILVPLAALAQEAVTLPSPEDLGSFLLEAARQVAAGNWSSVAALAIVALVFGLRKLGAKLWPWLATDAGGVVTLFVSTALLAVAAPLYAGTAVGQAALVGALSAALSAAGGWAAIRKVLRGVLPLITPYVARLPVVGSILAVVLRYLTPPNVAAAVRKETEKAYAPADPKPTMAQAAAALSKPPAE
jgi:hypothetical protein